MSVIKTIRVLLLGLAIGMAGPLTASAETTLLPVAIPSE